MAVVDKIKSEILQNTLRLLRKMQSKDKKILTEYFFFVINMWKRKKKVPLVLEIIYILKKSLLITDNALKNESNPP